MTAIELERWRKKWGDIGHAEAERPWNYGDLFNAGRQFVDGKLSDEDAHQEIAALIPNLGECGLSLRQLKIYGWVSMTFPAKRRRPSLSWSHHREVWAARVPTGEQRKWLMAAELKNLTVRELRVAMAPETRPEAMKPHPIAFVARRWNDQGVQGLREMFPPGQTLRPDLLASLRRELDGILAEFMRVGLIGAGP